jgi:hypothetical protein
MLSMLFKVLSTLKQANDRHSCLHNSSAEYGSSSTPGSPHDYLSTCSCWMFAACLPTPQT